MVSDIVFANTALLMSYAADARTLFSLLNLFQSLLLNHSHGKIISFSRCLSASPQLIVALSIGAAFQFIFISQKMYTEQKGNIFPSLLLMAFGSPDSLFCFLVQTHLKMSFLIRREQHSNQLWKKNSRKIVYVFLFHPLQLTYFFLFAFLSSTLIK